MDGTVLYRNNCIPIIAYHIIARTSRIAYQIIDNQIAMSYAINRYAITFLKLDLELVVFLFFFILGGPPGAPGPRPPQNENMQLNQLHHFFHEKNFAAESAA